MAISALALALSYNYFEKWINLVIITLSENITQGILDKRPKELCTFIIYNIIIIKIVLHWPRFAH